MFNPVAGGGDKVEAGTLAMALDAAGWQTGVYATVDHQDLPSMLRQRIDEEGPELDLVVAVGGDGTVALAAEALALQALDDAAVGAGASLGIVPVGTANVMARELGVPTAPERAIELITTRHGTKAVDGMKVGPRMFFLQIGIGLDALMIRDTSPQAKRRMGRLAYMRTLVQKAVGHEAHEFGFHFDDTWVRLRAWQVLLANAGTLGVAPFTWGPAIDPSDGVLDLCVYHVRGPLDWLKLAGRVLTNHHRRDTNQRYFRVHRNIRVWARDPQPAQADGEMLGETPFTVRVVPSALEIVAPLRE